VQQIVEHNLMFGIPVSQRDANTLVMVVVVISSVDGGACGGVGVI